MVSFVFCKTLVGYRYKRLEVGAMFWIRKDEDHTMTVTMRSRSCGEELVTHWFHEMGIAEWQERGRTEF